MYLLLDAARAARSHFGISARMEPCFETIAMRASLKRAGMSFANGKRAVHGPSRAPRSPERALDSQGPGRSRARAARVSLVGLPDHACNDARDPRAHRGAQQRYQLPQKKITVNLAPGDLRRAGRRVRSAHPSGSSCRRLVPLRTPPMVVGDWRSRRGPACPGSPSHPGWRRAGSASRS